MARNQQLTQYKKTISFEDLQKAIIGKRGNLTAVAKVFKVTRNTIYSRIKDNPILIDTVIESREICLDEAEQSLQDKIKEGDLTAIIFYLKTQGKRRGYIERQENFDITLDLSKLTDDQLSRLAAGEAIRSILTVESESTSGTSSTETTSKQE